MINPHQFFQHLENFTDDRGVVSGTPAKQAMRQLNIRPVPRIGDSPSMVQGVNWEESWDFDESKFKYGYNTRSVRPDERLYTVQSHFHLPTLKRYTDEGPEGWESQEDPDFGSDIAYRPMVYRDQETNREWIDEGHHRIMAARLRDESVDVHTGYSG